MLGRHCYSFVVLMTLLLAQASGAEDLELTLPVQVEGVSTEMLGGVRDVVEQQLTLAADKALSAPLADDLAFFVRRHYLAAGYKEVAVNWQMKDSAVLLVVNEGRLGEVGEVSFSGNPDLDEDELRAYLLRPTKERLGKLKSGLPYVAAEVQQGLDLLLRYLLSQGYLDAEVSDPVTSSGVEGKVNLHVEIKAGPQWHISTVSCTGLPALLEKAALTEAAALQGEVANEARLERTRRSLEGMLQANGYFLAKVQLQTSRSSGQQLETCYAAEPGPLHAVGELRISDDLSRGATRLLRSAFRPALGYDYDAKRMEMAHGRVLDTGIFHHLEMTTEVVADATLGLAFSGEEAPRHSIGLSGGYDTFLGPILGIEYKNVNFWDSGGQLRAKIVGTMLGAVGSLQWKNPAVFSSAYALTIDLKPESFVFKGYDRYSGGLRVGLSRDINSRLSAEAYLNLSTNWVSSDVLSIMELGAEQYTFAAAGLSLLYEGRDNPVSPTQGWYASGSAEMGDTITDITEFSYARLELAVSYYLPLTKRWRSSYGARFASIVSNEDIAFIPIDMRVFNGGMKGVRGFQERELGPLAAVDGTPLGGAQSATLSAELSYELMNNLELAGFMDAGSLGGDPREVLPQFSDLRYAAGLGLRYRFPFGPLRVDYGVNLNRRRGERPGMLHVGFGFAF